MNQTKIFGLSAALVTPFHPSGDLDLVRMARHAKSVVAGGCDGITVFGTTGEGYGISLRERRDILNAIAKDLPENAAICAGILTPDITTAADMALAAYQDGASRLLLAPPFFMKDVDDDGLFEWFSAVFDNIGSPLKNVILYHIPGQTAVPISIELVARLRTAYPGIISGIKDSSGDGDTTRKYLSAHGDISILVGDERQLPNAMANGAEGSICGVANFLPAQLRRIIHEGGDGQLTTRIVDLVVNYPVIQAVKTLTAHVSDDKGYRNVRPPLSKLSDASINTLIRNFDAVMAKP